MMGILVAGCLIAGVLFSDVAVPAVTTPATLSSAATLRKGSARGEVPSKSVVGSSFTLEQRTITATIRGDDCSPPPSDPETPATCPIVAGAGLTAQAFLATEAGADCCGMSQCQKCLLRYEIMFDVPFAEIPTVELDADDERIACSTIGDATLDGVTVGCSSPFGEFVPPHALHVTATGLSPPIPTATNTPSIPSVTPTATNTPTRPSSGVSIEVGFAAAAPGETVTVAVSLKAPVEQVAATQNDIDFPREAKILSDPGHRPMCVVNPDINKTETTFAFLPPGCEISAAGGTGIEPCTGLRVLLLSLSNADPIPDGSGLYTCVVQAAASAIPGTVLPLVCSNSGASDPEANAVLTGCTDGQITVVTPGPTNTPTNTPTSTHTPTVTRTPTPTTTPTPNPTYVACTGNCDAGPRVTVDELIRGVNIALGNLPFAMCPAFDLNRDNLVAINELIRAVNNLLFGCGFTPATRTPTATQTPSDPTARGLAFLRAGNLRQSRASFEEALQENNADERANLLFAITRIIVRVLDDPMFTTFAERIGYTIDGETTNICEFELYAPDQVSAGAPRTGEILAWAREIVLPEITGALGNLSKIRETTTISIDVTDLPPCLRPSDDSIVSIEVDNTDVLALEATLETVLAGFELSEAYDLDASLFLLFEETPGTVLEVEFSLLTLRSASNLIALRGLLNSAVLRIIAALSSALAEADDQSDDLLVIESEDVEEASDLVEALESVRQSFTQQVVLPQSLGLPEAQRLNLNPFFSGRFASLRSFLPLDDEGAFDVHSFPDPTFGGTLPDMTQDLLDIFLSGGKCQPCNTDEDCRLLGVSLVAAETSCFECSFLCTGGTRRCAPVSDFVTCEDGEF